MKLSHYPKVAVNCAGILVTFVAGMVFGAYDLAPRSVLSFVQDAVAQAYHERNTLTGLRPDHFLQFARHDGDGVTVNQTGDDLVLLSGFFDKSNGLRLIRRDGTAVADWPVRFSEIFPDTSHLFEPPVTDWNIDIHGAVIEPDGSVVFNFEYAGLVKINRCGEVLWTLPRMTHHSVERAEGGGYWVPGRNLREEEITPFPPFQTPLLEDTLLHVSDDGEVLREISLPQVLYDNGFEAQLTATGARIASWDGWDREIVHLNKIEELTSDLAADFPMFEAGDLALSIREHNLVLVVDPDDGKVKWSSTGPWLRQHDPEFRAGGTMVVFNNNVYKTAYETSAELTPRTFERGSNIVAIDPADGSLETLYGHRAGQEMLTIIRGKVDLTPGGGMMVTEFEAGRAFEVDAEGNLVWEYVNSYDDDTVAEITEVRAYPYDYFTVTDWNCSPRLAQDS